MFKRRLKVLLILLSLPALGIVLRLVQLQVLAAAGYRAEAERMLLCPASYLPCLRGDITDHEGRKLAYNAPSWNICVQYRAIVQDTDYLRMLARRRRPGAPVKSAQQTVAAEIAASWQAIAQLTGTPLPELQRVADRIVREVAMVKEEVSQRQQVQTVVTEEQIAHPVVKELDQNQQVQARERLKGYEWVEVVPDQVRRYAGGPAVGALLGRLGQVDAQALEKDPRRDDDLARYRAGDLRGISGLEALGEGWLRGRRGRTQEDQSGRLVSAAIEPLNGRTLRLSIDRELQQACYDDLRATVEHTPFCTGGAAVLLDIPSRQVLALVSCPAYDPNISWRELLALASDRLRQPAVCRPLQAGYPPGSTVKPMLLAGALADGTVTAETRFICEGKLFPELERWHCTAAHGPVDPIFAVQHSCNVFFYHLGEKVGTPRLAWWMQQFGLGRRALNFPQETPGHLPSTLNVGFARLAAIGQGEVELTPLQAANMAATLASGAYRPPTLWVDDPAPRPAVKLEIPESAWRIVREGMFRVVNAVGGTGHPYATLEAGRYVLLGKTGSATGTRRPAELLFTCHLPDGGVKEEVAANAAALQAKYPGARITGGRPTQLWPPEGIDPTHAWFIGYLSTREHYLEVSSGAAAPAVALAVVVEYGGHGGAGAGPLARTLAGRILERQTGTPLIEVQP